MGWLIALGAVLAGFWWALPRERVRTDVTFDDTRLDVGVEPYLATEEARVPDLRPGVAKRVLWAGAPEAATDWAVVYVHGFSATSEELRPLPDRVADGLGANLVFARLSGHGRSGAAMAEPSVEDWMRDVAEALAVGRRVGRRVLVMGCSTGCTLLTLALRERMSAGVAGAVMIAPNYALKAQNAHRLTWPGARWFLPLVQGRERGFTPSSEAHGRFWTPRYPTVALLPMAAAVKRLNQRDPARVTVPGLFVFDDRDALVDHARTREIAARWGAGGTVMAVETGPGDDPGHHVIAGDILSPGMTEPVAQGILTWVTRTLPAA